MKGPALLRDVRLLALTSVVVGLVPPALRLAVLVRSTRSADMRPS